MKAALIGLPQCGKSTLLSAISNRQAATIGSTNIEEAIVPVPDERLDFLTGLYEPRKTVCATIDCLDMPAVSFADSSARTAARRLFNQIRTVDLLVMVIRNFSNPAVPPYNGSVDVRRDLNDLQTELLLADLELVSTRIERLEKQVHKPTKTQQKDKAELAVQLELQSALEQEQPASDVIKTPEQLEIVKSLGLLTLKPIVVVVNTDEADINKNFELAEDVPMGGSAEVIALCATIEAEIAQLDKSDRAEFMADLGIEVSAAHKFVQSCYKALGLISFLTVGKDEVRAWPIKAETTALEAAGKIHSDIQRGFIRAETMSYDDLKELGDEKQVKAAGKVRLEGKNYIVKDGDIISFRFNV